MKTARQANAGMMQTDIVLQETHRDRIATALDRSDVRAQLEARGVNPDEVKARVAALTEEERPSLLLAWMNCRRAACLESSSSFS